MRIRRHANLDAGGGAGRGGDAFRPSLCVLNQSPWDVIPFSPDSPLQGFWVARPGDDGDGDDAADWDAGVGGTPAVLGEMKEEYDPLQEQHDLAPISMFRPAELPAAGEGEEEEEEGGKGAMCAKRGGKGWRCGNEARKGGALCDHHAALRQCYRARPQPAAGKSRRRAAAKPGGGGGGGGSDYYYYSGFGPRWRKRRGKESESESEHRVPAPAMPEYPAADLAAAESGSGEGSGGEGGRRRRRRKPMKKRSLMSLL